MVFNGERINSLRNGETVLCSVCKTGKMRPQLPDVDLKLQTAFVCDKCGSFVHIHLSKPNKPACLRSTDK